MAIQLACKTLQTHPIYSKPMELIIFSDSLSSLQALASTEIKNKVVRDTHDLGYNVELCWIKAHNDYKGNEIANQEA